MLRFFVFMKLKPCKEEHQISNKKNRFLNAFLNRLISLKHCFKVVYRNSDCCKSASLKYRMWFHVQTMFKACEKSNELCLLPLNRNDVS